MHLGSGVRCGSAYGRVEPWADRLLGPEEAAADANTNDLLGTAVISPTLTIARENTGNSQSSMVANARGLRSITNTILRIT